VSQIPLDNPTRGTTTLLAQCVNSSGTVVGTTSSQLADGTTLGDGTGDLAFNLGRKLKQWGADVNTMTSLMLGNYLAVAPAASQNNWDPTGGSPGNLAAISRLDLNPSQSIDITGLIATDIADEKRITVRNVSQLYTVTLQHQNVASAAANQFYGPGLDDFILNPGMAVDIIYYLIPSGPTYWVIKP
jgi:hypothetical protein